MKAEVHDTAFLVAHYRAQNTAFSKDPFAYIWSKPSLNHLTDGFKKEVSAHDELLHQMRNQIFLGFLQTFCDLNQDSLFINLGAGFSMYPYVLPTTITTIEIDFNNIVAYKEAYLNEQIDKLPQRTVLYEGGDITKSKTQHKLSTILDTYIDHPKVILIEGVFFFLSIIEIEKLFTYLKKVMKTGDCLLVNSYAKEIESFEVYKRLKKYFKKVLVSGNTTTISHSFYEQRDGFKLIEMDSTFKRAKQKNAIAENITEQDILNEYCYKILRL